MAKQTPIEWLDQIEMGLEYRRMRGLEESWPTLEALFYGVHHDQSRPGPNLFMSRGDAIISALSVPEPAITVSPMTEQGIEGAKIVERVDNNLIYDLDLPQEFEEAILNAFLYGVGVLKIGFDSEFGWAPEQQLAVGNQDLGMTLSSFSSRGEKIEYDSRIRPGMPWVRSIPPQDICVPWGTRRFDDAPWCAQRFVRTLSDLKADPKYKVPKDLRANLSGKDFVNSYLSTIKRMSAGSSAGQDAIIKNLKHGEYVECWEIHDVRTKKVMVVTNNSDKFLRNETDHLQIDGLPYVPITFIPRARWFWVTPEAFYLLSPQSELLDIHLQAQKQRRLGVLKFLVRKGLISDAAMAKILSPEVGAVAELDELEVDDIRKVLMPFTAYNNNAQLYADAEVIRRDARETTGGSRNQAGQYEPGRKTAYEAATVREGANLRTGRRTGVIASAYKNVFRKINAIVGKMWRRQRWVDMGDGYVPYNGDTFRGGYRYKVGFSVAPVPDVLQRRQEGMQMYLMLSQDPGADKEALREYIATVYNDPLLDRVLISGGSNADIRARMSQLSATD